MSDQDLIINFRVNSPDEKTALRHVAVEKNTTVSELMRACVQDIIANSRFYVADSALEVAQLPPTSSADIRQTSP
jgi:hypothetical protein